MSKLFGIHYTNVSNGIAGYEMAYCNTVEDIAAVKPHLQNADAFKINEIVELDSNNHTNKQWEDCVKRISDQQLKDSVDFEVAEFNKEYGIN